MRPLKPFFRRAAIAAALSVAAVAAAAAQQSAPMPAAIAAPRDVAYSGTIRLDVDATDAARGIFRVRETVPVAGGPITLLYPEWLPGNHAPRGPLNQLAGLEVRAGGNPIPWRRDPVNPYAFHIEAPANARTLDLSFQYLSPTAANQGRVVVTREMLNLQWNAVVLYPAGHYASRIRIVPRLTLPPGWRFGAALDGAQTQGAATTFAETDLETLVDSPLFAGRHFRRIDLDPGGRTPFFLNIVADRADQLEADDDQIRPHRNLVQQAYRLFGSRPFDHYDFLFGLSDRMGGIGLEHHRSSENALAAGYFTDWDDLASRRTLLPHELVHAWNGKYRRPADLWTPEYSVPMRDGLLWVYEGMTQYYGFVLTARSGLWTREQALDALAIQAAIYQNRVGRAWRPLQDTTNDPVIAGRRPQAWRSWQRSEDYYSEAMLIWLDADTLIRERSGGRRSLDDFARAFFAGEDGSWRVSTYAFDDVVATLNRVQPHDWATFLRDRVERAAAAPPLDGLARGGYRLVYADERTPFQTKQESHEKNADFMYSIGLLIGEGAAISQVQWDSPAFNAGITVGGTIVAVNGQTYSPEAMRRAIGNAKASGEPIALIVKNGDQYATYTLAYRGGLRYPRLERTDGVADRLAAILAPRTR
jgi:predicted metalloprotease with PDZ domain